MTEANESRNVMRKYAEAVQARDASAVRELFADEATWRLDAGELPHSGTWKGREAVIDDFLRLAKSRYQPGSLEVEITDMIGSGDRVVLQWTSRARTLDGQPYENGCIAIFTIADGKIQAVREYMDTLYVRDLLFA